jgi:hypothetical protein
MVFNAVKKVPTTFLENTLQAIKDAVAAIPYTFNSSTWNTVSAAANMIPSTFNSNTLQQMYNNVNSLMNGGSGSGESGNNSSVDYSKDI